MAIVPFEVLGADRWGGSAALAGATLLAAWLLRAQALLRRAERSRWWASSGRDVINATALLIMAGALVQCGFSAPEAVAIGGTMFLALSVALRITATQLPTGPWTTPVAAAFALLVAAPAMIWPGWVGLWLRRVTEWLL